MVDTYNKNVDEINLKIDTLLALIPKAIENGSSEMMEDINSNLDCIVELREEIVSRATVERLRLLDLSEMSPSYSSSEL